MLRELSEKIWERPGFQAEYAAVMRRMLWRSLESGQLHFSEPDDAPPDQGQIRRMLQSAMCFAGSGIPECEEAALRIAVAVWLESAGTAGFGSEGDLGPALRLILGRLGNFPTLDFLVGRNGDRAKGLPQSLWLEVSARELANSIKIDESHALLLTDFQENLWDRLTTGVPVSLSAPTSAGKSFVLQRFIARECIAGSARYVLYLVPTRALITEVASQIHSVALDLGTPDLTISTIPVPPAELAYSRGVYVLTQERTQLLLQDTEIRFDIIVVDEAQQIADGSRGVILESVLSDLTSGEHPPRVLFSSPQTENPEVFKSLLGLPELEAIRTDETPVVQNLLTVVREPVSGDSVTISRWEDGGSTNVTEARLPFPVLSRDDALASLSWLLGARSQNLVYADGPARCEKIALKLTQLVASDSDVSPASGEVTSRRASLAEFFRTHVHRDYVLAATVEAGIGIHYGNMPSAVRIAVEEAFADGSLDFLVCTSTLLHGVNLPAANLFLHDPIKGRDEGISPVEFWNLAGRAGRLGKDFQGNVFLLDPAEWRAQPFAGERLQTIRPSFREGLTENPVGIVDFLWDRAANSGEAEHIESVSARLFNQYRARQLEESDHFASLSEDVRSDLLAALEHLEQDNEVPDQVLRRNSTIAPQAQQRLLSYFERRIDEIDPIQLLPWHPARGGRVYQNLLRVFKRIHTYLEGTRGSDDSHKFFAAFALNWMRGYPLPRLIEDQHKRRQERLARPLIHTTIREVLGNIEQDLRFRYVKYTRCYTDLLRHTLETKGHADLIERIPPLPLFLELGASSGTMISLIGLGLSRTTAGLVADVAARKDLDRRACQEWLQQGYWERSDLPDVCKREIARLV